MQQLALVGNLCGKSHKFDFLVMINQQWTPVSYCPNNLTPKISVIFILTTRGLWPLWNYSEWNRLFTAFGLSGHIMYLWPCIISDSWFFATRGNIAPRLGHGWIPLVLFFRSPVVTLITDMDWSQLSFPDHFTVFKKLTARNMTQIYFPVWVGQSFLWLFYSPPLKKPRIKCGG